MKRVALVLMIVLVALGVHSSSRAGGESVLLPAPYPVVRGQPVVLGVLTGIASGPASAGALVRVWREGVFPVAKVTGAAWTRGDPLYFEAGDAGLSKVPTKVFFGIAATPASTGAATGTVILVPSGPFGSLSSALDVLETTIGGLASAFTTSLLTTDTLSAANASIGGVQLAGGTVDGVDVYALSGTVTTDSARVTTLETNAGFAKVWNETGQNTDNAEHAFTAAISLPAMSVGEALELHVWWLDGVNPDGGVITYRSKIGSEVITSTGGTLGGQTRQSHGTVFCTAPNTYAFVQWNASTATANFNQNTFVEGKTGVGSPFTITFSYQFGTAGGNNRCRMYATLFRKFRAGP